MGVGLTLNTPVHTVREFSLSGGPEGVRETLYLMRRLARDFKINPYIVVQSRLALAGVPVRNWRAEAEALCRHVQRTVRYTADVRDVETLIDPVTLLRDVRAGDCDDMSLALATLLESVDHPTRFVACGFDYDPPGELTHVFVQTKIGADWLTLDPSEQEPPGWEPPDVRSCFVVNV